MSDILETVLSQIPEPEKVQAPEASTPEPAAPRKQGIGYHPDFEREFGKRP